MATPHVDSLPEAARLVDLDRHPIHDLDGARGRELIATSRAEFERTGACNLQGFVTPHAAAELAAEAEGLMPLAYRKTYTCNFLFEAEPDPSRLADHPGNRFWTWSSAQLADDQIGPATGLRQLYEWEALTELVAKVQGKIKLYRFADEFQALNVIAIGEGERGVWHHDSNECTVTLLLQAPEAGGEFVYGPDTRAPDGRVDLDAVRHLIEARGRGAQPAGARQRHPHLVPGGGRSLHGVLPVRGPRERIRAILTYDPDPARVASDDTNRRIYGRRVERILDERRTGRAAAGGARSD